MATMENFLKSRQTGTRAEGKEKEEDKGAATKDKEASPGSNGESSTPTLDAIDLRSDSAPPETTTAGLSRPWQCYNKFFA